jgi:hypothetical protein
MGISEVARRLRAWPLLALWTALPASAAQGLVRQFDEATTLRLGRAIYEQDRRAAIAAELLADNFDPAAEGLIGFITVGAPPRLTVRFVRRTDDGHRAAIDAVFDDLLLPTLERATDPRLDAAELAQIEARLAVGEDAATRCDGRYNVVVLPDPDGEGFLAYALAATTEPERVMVGGHVRYSVSADGRRLELVEALSTSCAVAARADLELAARTGGGEGLALRTTLADRPLESHVFLSLVQDLPLFVVGRDLRLWRVDGNGVVLERERPGEQPGRKP